MTHKFDFTGKPVAEVMFAAGFPAEHIVKVLGTLAAGLAKLDITTVEHAEHAERKLLGEFLVAGVAA